jgi:hypothetical protein
MSGCVDEDESREKLPTARTDAMSANPEKSNSFPTFKSGLLITGRSLIGAGASAGT